MPVIVVANPKGGVGKSTLATQVAGMLARTGQRVMLGDVDRQASARQWLALRPAEVPAILGWEVRATGLPKPPSGTSHVVLDTPAGLSPRTLDKLLRIADKLLVPLQASLFDIQATHPFLQSVAAHPRTRSGAVDVGLVATRVREHTQAAGHLGEYLRSLPFPVVTSLRDTQNYVHLAAHGLTLWDIAPGRVERDLEQWMPLAAWLQR
jgi:chromosome partitioning protein